MKFICDIGIVQIYLGKWGEKRTLTKPLSKFWEKVGKRREKWCDECRREKKEFRQWYCPKYIYIYIYIKDYTLREKNMRFCILINGMAFMHSLQTKILTLAGMFRCHIFFQRGAHMSPTKDSPLSCFSIISLAKKYALFTVKIPFFISHPY